MISNCPICNNCRHQTFQQTILHKYKIGYLFCDNCGLLQTEKPYWLEEAYSDAIASCDTGLVARNLSTSKKLARILYFLFGKNEKYLDIGGGYGLLTRLMRDIGFDFYWSDLYCQNLLAKGFELTENEKKFSVITAFELLEHIENPLEFIKTSLAETGASTIIFSTTLFNGNPPPFSWWYYCFETGQHISFYQIKTLSYIAKELSLNFYSNQDFHILTNRKINFNLFSFLTHNLSSTLYFYINRKLSTKIISDSHLILEKYFSNCKK